MGSGGLEMGGGPRKQATGAQNGQCGGNDVATLVVGLLLLLLGNGFIVVIVPVHVADCKSIISKAK
jgi:hypothetical protein